MKTLYSAGAFQELEISGTSQEWTTLCLAIGYDETSIPCETIVELPENCVAIERVQIRHLPTEKVRFQLVNEQTIEIVGDPTLLELLSKTMSNFATDFADGNHIHVEYQGENHFVDRRSICAVFSRP